MHRLRRTKQPQLHQEGAPQTATTTAQSKMWRNIGMGDIMKASRSAFGWEPAVCSHGCRQPAAAAHTIGQAQPPHSPLGCDPTSKLSERSQNCLAASALTLHSQRRRTTSAYKTGANETPQRLKCADMTNPNCAMVARLRKPPAIIAPAPL